MIYVAVRFDSSPYRVTSPAVCDTLFNQPREMHRESAKCFGVEEFSFVRRDYSTAGFHNPECRNWLSVRAKTSCRYWDESLSL